MPKFAANLTMLFNELPFLDRFRAAAGAGFQGIEFLFPYQFHDDQIAEKLDRYLLSLVLHNLPAGDWAAGERGIACLPNRIMEFQDGVGEAIRYARRLGCHQLNCLAGILPAEFDPIDARETLIKNLRFAATELKTNGIKLLIEPINTYDIPGFYLSSSRQAVDIIKAVGSDNIYLQYDIYHMQIMEGNIARTMQENIKLIAHIQIADNPGRNEPGSGEINYPFLFEHIDRIGYQDWIGCEYKPAVSTTKGLRWRQQMLTA